MKTAVCGAAGNLGSAVIKAARAAGHEVCALDRHSLEVTDGDQVEAVLRRLQPQLVINCAAFTDVQGAQNDPACCAAVNTAGARQVALGCARLGAAHIYISTDYVFGDTPGPHREDEAPQPLNIYGRTKLAGEEAVLACAPRSLVVRTGSLFGPRGRSFVRTLLHLMKAQEQRGERGRLQIVADNLIMPTPAAALAEALITLGEYMVSARPDGGGAGTSQRIFHYAGLPALSSAAFAGFVARAALACGKISRLPEIVPVRQQDYHSAAARPLDLRLDCRLICQSFNLQLPLWENYLAETLTQGG